MKPFRNMEYKVGNKYADEKHYVSYKAAIDCAVHYFNEKLKAAEWTAFKNKVLLIIHSV